jgi:HEPN domain-containing protein
MTEIGENNKSEINAEKIVSYWIGSSDNDFDAMNHLFRSKDYHWSLFVGHLVIEKLLKAYFVKNQNEYPPFIHDLRRLAEAANLTLTADQKLFFDTVTRFNISARYDDYKLKFYTLCTREWTEKIEEYRKWIKETLLKS